MRSTQRLSKRQPRRQLQLSLCSWCDTSPTPTEIQDTVSQGDENRRPENHLTRVEERMLLELLVTCRGFTVALSGIDDATARDALSLGWEAKDPTEANDRYDREESGEPAHSASHESESRQPA
jgi:hypothetical protein